MPKGSPTTMFVSSTCYDLSQVRADIRDFASSLGYDPVLSELDTFHVHIPEHEKPPFRHMGSQHSGSWEASFLNADSGTWEAS